MSSLDNLLNQKLPLDWIQLETLICVYCLSNDTIHQICGSVEESNLHNVLQLSYQRYVSYPIRLYKIKIKENQCER